ncbi:centromere protein R isoform X1 [Ahaetulla prasina]|uniref:centromere protein R isoform X1 n=1 Tax=Ahaetulla prasina TaxID=499056 RepID=UPI0026483EF4|nr:centromere protein R isoform X1 [Ahaetulla prasina]
MMPRAKRALKLENLIPEKMPATSSVKGKKNSLLFSPITGTCLMSSFSSPRSNHAKEQRNDLSYVLSSCRNTAKESDEIRESDKVLPTQSNRKEQHQMKNNDKLLVLQSEVEHSLERFLKIRKNLTNLKALEGTGELENILGTSNKPGNLKIEVRKSRKLIEQVRKRNLQKPGAVRLSTQENLQPANSFAFLKSLIG